MEKIMTNYSQASILNLMSRRVHNFRFRKIPDFIEHMLALNKVICYKCRNQIKVGTHYNTSTKGNTIRKHYHSKCLERLYQ